MANSNEKVRLFIALLLPEDIKEYIYKEISSPLRKTDVRASFVRPENMHVTVKFLGDTDTEMIPDIIKLMKDSARGHGLFECNLSRVSSFGGKNPRVVHVEPECNELDRLVELVKKTDIALSGLGFATEKRTFTPHITICRIRDPKTATPIRDKIDDININKLPFLITDIALMKSTLTPHGAIYDIVESIKLI